MRTILTRKLAAVVAAALLLPALASKSTHTSTWTWNSGCALTSRGATLDVRWYTPEQARESLAVAELQGGCPLRLGRVTSGADLGTRIAFGDGGYRVGYHEDRRWTERPDHYVQRALERTLFEGGGFRSSTRGPMLDVELLDFKEVKGPTVHAAQVAVRVVLTRDTDQFARTIVISRPVAGDRFDDFVAAMSSALQETADEVAKRVRLARGGCEEKG